MVKVAAVNVSVNRERVVGRLNREEEANSCSSTLDICLEIKMKIFSGEELIYESPINPITIRSISLPCHSNIQNPTLWRSSIESSLSSLSDCPELLCAKDLLLRPTQISAAGSGTQILEDQQSVCIIDLVAERVASAASSSSSWALALPTIQNSNSNTDSSDSSNDIGLFGMFHFVAHVEIVSVLTGIITPELGHIFKRDLKKFNAIDELKKQAFQVVSSSSSSSSSSESVGGDCSICLQDLSVTGIDLIRLSNCKHVFHQKCILPWLKTSNLCPLCRDLCFQKSI